MFTNYKQQLFLYWLILFGLIVFGIFVCWDRGLVSIIVFTDQSRICFVIALVFAFGTLHCSTRAKYLSNQSDILLELEKLVKSREFISCDVIDRNHFLLNSELPINSIPMTYVRQSGALEPSASSDQSHSNLALDVLVSKAKNSLDVGWFVVDILIKLGLLGTIIGFILMLASVSVSDNMDVTGLQSIIKNMSTGMGTALYTTLAGLLASILLALQYLLIERGSDALIEGSVNLSLELFPPCTAD